MAAEEISFPQRAASWPMRLKNYVEDLQMEMRKVTWPSWKQVRATTAVVIASVFLFSAYFFVVDNIISKIINKLFATFTK
ncbi:MAG TPA: preprotein translocase subunit SecE [Bryobacteraceae bacterium]|jgi:preprotein translocase subunit SecE|nr:preprotein translocase subunit SecE [Bryobacteraceae bacterium]